MADHVTHGALAVASRRHLLDVLRASPNPLDVKELAETTGLHTNTVRFHLNVLINAGYVAQRGGRRSGPGRPQAVYTATTPQVDEDGYRLLAEMLAGQLDETGGGEVAQRAGRRWVGRAGSPGAADETSPIERATGRAVALFTELGFDPVAERTGAGTRVQLRACPFIEVARRHPDIACGLHRGLLSGATETVAGDAVTVDLLPFAQPGVCIAELSPTVREEQP